MVLTEKSSEEDADAGAEAGEGETDKVDKTEGVQKVRAAGVYLHQLGGVSSKPPSRPRNSYSRGSVDFKTVTRVQSSFQAKDHTEEICTHETPIHKVSELFEDISDDEMLDNGGLDEDLDEGVLKAYDHTGKTKYKQACETYGVVPISSFLRNMNQTELVMMHYGLGPQGAKAISVSLITNTSITKLNLKDNWLEAEGARAITEMLMENCYITDVDLSDNQLGVDGAKAISSMLMENITLLRATLSGNHFDDQAAEHLAEAISTSHKLKYLDLSHNKIGNTLGEELGNALADNSGIIELDLSWNYLRGKACTAVAEGLSDNIYLKILNLSYNGFGNEGAKALGIALKVNNVLEQLNISNNRISPEGAVWLSMGLRNNNTLIVLNMARNPMQSAGCYGILKALKENPKSAIEFLDFSDIRVNKDFEDLFNDVKQHVPKLVVKHEKNADLFKKPRSKADPLTKLKEFMKVHHLQLEHFLDNFDITENRFINLKEFRTSLENAKVPLNDVEQDKLMILLDKDKEGEIDFSDLNDLLLGTNFGASKVFRN
ncbi:leucine-rich repeat-containing protein 74B-like [Chiloscyllium plagiosum]|uniref:leucine-rich repeat-containing protein 74B-like n=1 Tax=Chiloscyllium plagiosum TaxID=36176 RepID=UPI001CB85AF6|nr:leucine-rich repeat-containing protein 74B-like [Chiloscyllium plagiosum]